MVLVVLPVHPPAVLAGQTNGKLPASLLVATPGQGGGPTVRLVSPAHRAWRALAGSAAGAGISLNTTGLYDSYRPYAVQVNLFTKRYGPDPTNNGYKWWDSDNSGTPERWYKQNDENGDPYATAAVPGTSNHGLGLAVDVANAAGRRLVWLEANAVRFGWSWETVPEEPWHLRYVTGDTIPPAVLAYEETHEMTPDEHRMLANEDRQLTADLNDQDTVTQINGNLSFPNHTRNRLVALETASAAQTVKLDQILALLQAGGGTPPTGPVRLDAESVAEIRDAVADLGEGGAAQVREDA